MSDLDLIQKIRSGQIDSYGDLVQKYQNKVRGHCYAFLSDYRDSAEAAQDIFVKAYQSLHKFRGKSSFSTWLYRITSNHCLDILRQRKRRKTISLEALVEQKGEPMESFGATTPNTLGEIENKQIVEKILSTVSKDSRMVLTLREVDGLDYQELAQALNCTLHAVKGRLTRARKQLRRNWGSYLIYK